MTSKQSRAAQLRMLQAAIDRQRGSVSLVPALAKRKRPKVSEADRIRSSAWELRQLLETAPGIEPWPGCGDIAAGAQIFQFPLPPLMSNGSFSRAGHRVSSAVRSVYRTALDCMFYDGLFPSRPTAPWLHVNLRVCLYVGAEMDFDGSVSRTKWATDWLVDAGYLAGDKRRHIDWLGQPAQVVSRKQVYRMVYLIEPTTTA